MTSFFDPAQSPTPNLAPPQLTGSEALHIARKDDALASELSDMSERAVTEFLITCARAVNEAAKRNDLEAVHAIYHAECAALLEIHNRQGAMQ